MDNIPIISCDICMDLLPLVQDDVASKDSKQAVLHHLQTCTHCQVSYTGTVPPPRTDRITHKLRRHLLYLSLSLIVVGVLYGLAIAAGEFMFYNAIIMPVIGAIGYFALRKQCYYTLVFVFVSVYLRWLWDTLGYLQSSNIANAFLSPFFWAIIYTTLCALGMVTAALLHFGFRKEPS